MIRRALKRADRIITVSYNSKRDLVDYFGIAAGAHRRHLQRRRPAVPPRRPARRAGPRGGAATACRARTCSSSAARSRTRTSATCLRAFAEARRERALPHALVLAGPDAQEPQPRRGPDLGPRPRLARPCGPGIVPEEDLPGLFAGADAFLYPTLYEGFGLPVVEAMACGVPVLTSSTSALQEIAGGYAYLVDPMDVDAIAARHRGPGDRSGAPRGVRRARQAPRRATSPGTAPPSRRSRSTPRRSGRAEAERDVGAVAACRRPMRTAVVHDWLNGMRGGEKVLEAILPLVPEPTIFTLFHVPGSVSPAIERHPIRASCLNRLPFARRHYRQLPAALSRARSSPSTSPASTSSSPPRTASPRARSRRRASPHLCYCHTPVRYAYEQFDLYFPPGRTRLRALKAAADRAAARAGTSRRRRARRATSPTRPPSPSGSAATTGGRRRSAIRRSTWTSSTPGARAARATSCSPSARSSPTSASSVAIEAARARSAGGSSSSGRGPEEKRLARHRRLRRSSSVSGSAAARSCAQLYRTCALYLQPGEEDFGIAAVEALACGAPVVALARGGARDIVARRRERRPLRGRRRRGPRRGRRSGPARTQFDYTRLRASALAVPAGALRRASSGQRSRELLP